jgi:cellular nucleic acid-binding protein
LKPNCDDYDEDKITRQYMDKYGINNVRGGSFVSVKFDKSTIDILKKMSNGTNNKCFICGKEGHFAKNCQETESCDDSNDSDEEYEEVWACDYCGKEFIKEKKCEYHEKYCNSKYKKQIIYESYENDESDESDNDNCCFRCGREGHYASSCYASKHIKGYYLKK